MFACLFTFPFRCIVVIVRFSYSLFFVLLNKRGEENPFAEGDSKEEEETRREEEKEEEEGSKKEEEGGATNEDEDGTGAGE